MGIIYIWGRLRARTRTHPSANGGAYASEHVHRFARLHKHAQHPRTHVGTHAGLYVHVHVCEHPGVHATARKPASVHKRGRTIHARTNPHKRTTAPSPTIGGALTTPRERLTNPIPPTIPTHHPRGENPLERLKMASHICVTHTPICMHARAGLSAPGRAPGSPRAPGRIMRPRNGSFSIWPKKKPRSMAGLRVCIMQAQSTNTCKCVPQSSSSNVGL